eukprot:7513-Heterococcus_DN1.PRE.3
MRVYKSDYCSSGSSSCSSDSGRAVNAAAAIVSLSQQAVVIPIDAHYWLGSSSAAAALSVNKRHKTYYDKCFEPPLDPSFCPLTVSY